MDTVGADLDRRLAGYSYEPIRVRCIGIEANREAVGAINCNEYFPPNRPLDIRQRGTMKDEVPKTCDSILDRQMATLQRRLTAAEERLQWRSRQSLSADRNMTFTEAMDKLQAEGFSWHALRQYFPFGDLSLREGEHERLVCAVLDALPTEYEKELFISLLDTQICVYWEQMLIQDEMHERLGLELKFEGENHFALARLQIGANIRRRYGLKRREVRDAMMELGSDEMLLDRMTNATDGMKREVGCP